MRDPAELQELESMGEAPEEDFLPARRSSGSGVSIVQAALCVLALIALVVLKAAEPGTYGKISAWYREEVSREIQMPSFSWQEPPAEESSAPAPTETPEPSQAPGEEFAEIGSLQEI